MCVFYPNIIHTDDVHHMRCTSLCLLALKSVAPNILSPAWSLFMCDCRLCLCVCIRVYTNWYRCLYLSGDVMCVRVRFFSSYSFYLNSFYSVYQKADMQKIHTKPRRFSQHSFHSRFTLSGIWLSRSCDLFLFHSHSFFIRAVRMPLSQTLMFIFFIFFFIRH